MKLLIGGSPCTYWSIAQTKNRETEASGMGWELFRNYAIARGKMQPDYFLYENNKSMSAAIREQITQMLGVEPVLINSALVSAQNRERLYWAGHRRADGTYEQVPVEQPEDKGILLRDVLENGVCWREKAYTLRASAGTKQGMSNILRHIETNGKWGYQGVAVPVCVAQRGRYTGEGGAVEQHFEVQESGKSVTLCGNGGGVGAKTGLYATPVGIDHLGSLYGQHSRWGIFGVDGKAPTLTASAGMGGGHIPMYPVRVDNESGQSFIEDDEGKKTPVYEVRNGQITIKGKQYPIKLADGWYIIRKLTVRECMRLQTVPEAFEFPVSDSQAYKMLGNGWTVDVIAHIMAHFDSITTEPLDVLSMYDGMACGHIALDKLGANIRNYYATEIDKYAIATATHNFPDIVELGDAFQVRWDSVQA